jgi:Uma2 family endonuclease
MFISNDRWQSDLARCEKGEKSMELNGSPDMTLEIVSKSSIPKDTVDLMELYAKAGISEYWLVDSTVDKPVLDIYRLVDGKFVVARKHDGWVKSNVFGRAFRLTRKDDDHGFPQFNLEMK